MEIIRRRWIVCLLLGVAVLAAFGPALNCGFVNFDDNDYVVQNRNIQQGLDWHGLKWALTTRHAANWHPVTWISHMADFQLYGLRPWGHHLSSILLHAASSVLLFLVLERMTGAFWRSALVAALFALHPLRVESVVWISERKDVLSALFFMLTLGAYARYAERQGAKGWHGAALAGYALGLMAKPMLVTLPFVLLLVDYWPLRRMKRGARLLLEKIPFFVLAAASSFLTWSAQEHGGAMTTLRRLPLSLRLENVPVAYLRYVIHCFWPLNLAVYYPFSKPGAAMVIGAICLLGCITALVLWKRREEPYLLTGWLWFFGALVPVIGLVQVGGQAWADRYSYLPSVGLCIMVVWGAADWVAGHPAARRMAAAGAVAVVLLCAGLTSAQAGYWKDSARLFGHAVKVTGPNYIACYNLGCDAHDQGNYSLAAEHFQRALAAESDGGSWFDDSKAHNDLGESYLRLGQVSNAVAQLEKALALRPQFPEAYYNMGRAFMTNRQPDVAVECFQNASRLDPSAPQIQDSLSQALLALGRVREAQQCAAKASQLRLSSPR